MEINRDIPDHEHSHMVPSSEMTETEKAAEEELYDFKPCDCYTRVFPPNIGHDDQCSLKKKES